MQTVEKDMIRNSMAEIERAIDTSVVCVQLLFEGWRGEAADATRGKMELFYTQDVEAFKKQLRSCIDSDTARQEGPNDAV